MTLGALIWIVLPKSKLYPTSSCNPDSLWRLHVFVKYQILLESCATALATIEGENGDGPIQTITTIDHHGPLRALTALDHPSFKILRPLLDEATTGLHHLQAYLRAQDQPDDFHDRCQDCILLCELVCHTMGRPHTPHRADHLNMRFGT